MLEIYTFKLGYVGDVDLNQVARLVNITPNIVHLTAGDSVPNIGEPNLYGFGYSRAHLFGLFPPADKGVIRVGITIAPVEDNFYTLTHGLDSIVVTLFQVEEICDKARRTKEEYIAQTIVTEVLWLQYKAQKSNSHFTDLFHQDTRGCIFDFVAYKPDKVHKLRSGRIDPMCKGKLVEANVPESIVRTVEQIIARIHRPTFFRSLAIGLQSPLFSLVFGGLLFGLIINLVSSLIVGEFGPASAYYIIAILVFLTLSLAVGNYIRMIVSASKKQE